jgi:ABC-type multidrug transport system fused ATPase/permease subunit
MKRGKIIGQGTHEELMKTCDEYRKIFVKRFDLDEDQLIQTVIN